VYDHYPNPAARQNNAKNGAAIFSFKFNKFGLTQPQYISYTAELIAWITDPDGRICFGAG
jgi:hypothetical protein